MICWVPMAAISLECFDSITLICYMLSNSMVSIMFYSLFSMALISLAWYNSMVFINHGWFCFMDNNLWREIWLASMSFTTLLWFSWIELIFVSWFSSVTIKWFYVVVIWIDWLISIIYNFLCMDLISLAWSTINMYWLSSIVLIIWFNSLIRFLSFSLWSFVLTSLLSRILLAMAQLDSSWKFSQGLQYGKD